MDATGLYSSYCVRVWSALYCHWVLTLVGLLTVYVFKSYLSSRHALRKYNLPGPPIYPFIGTAYEMMFVDKYQMHKTFLREHQRYGDVYTMYLMSQPAIVVSDPEVLKSIFVKEFSNFSDRPTLGLKFPEPMKSMMTMLVGERWKHVRKILSPTFTSGKLKKVTGTMRMASDTFLQKAAAYANKEDSVDIYKLLQNVTMDVILMSAFGIESACQTDPNDNMSRFAKQATSPNPLFQLLLLLPFVSGMGITEKLMPTEYGLGYGNLQRITEKIIAQRKQQQNSNHTDMLAMALNATHPNKNGAQLTDNEVIGQSLIFLIAGYDTSSIVLGMLCYHLAIDQDIQQQLYEEIDDVIGDGEIEYERLSQLVYLEAVISEVLRLYPPAFVISRTINKDCDIAGIPFRTDMAVLCNVYAIHRNERYWQDPEAFNPDRFMPENADKIKPFTYLPFGHGPRNCIGSRFAQLEIKYVIINLIRIYRIEKGHDLCIPMKLIVKNILTIGEPVNVRLLSRQ